MGGAIRAQEPAQEGRWPVPLAIGGSWSRAQLGERLALAAERTQEADCRVRLRLVMFVQARGEPMSPGPEGI
jgi:hypothetical protein